jgi:hypothetical protein
MNHVNGEEKIDNYIGKQSHKTKVTSSIITSYDNKLQSTVCGTMLLCNHNEV